MVSSSLVLYHNRQGDVDKVLDSVLNSRIDIIIVLKFPTLINRWKNNSLSNFLCKLVIDKQLISKAKQQNCYGSKNRENI